ncbi:hypothetical protein ACSSS7_006625 [Eimeria intestinalis]
MRLGQLSLILSLEADPISFDLWKFASGSFCYVGTIGRLLRRGPDPSDCSQAVSAATQHFRFGACGAPCPRLKGLGSASGQGFFRVKWRTLLCCLVPSFLALVVVAVMAFPDQAKNRPQTTRLKTLLKAALSSEDACGALADAVKEAGIRVVAVDFDLTMISLHSGKCMHLHVSSLDDIR